jgi:hypothetical protein
MEKPTKGLVAWGEWGSSLVDESGSPPLKRWVVHIPNGNFMGDLCKVTAAARAASDYSLSALISPVYLFYVTVMIEIAVRDGRVRALNVCLILNMWLKNTYKRK